MTRLIREHIEIDAATLNLLEQKCTVIYRECRRVIYWWPLRTACVIGVGQDYEIIWSEDWSDITIRMIMTAYEFGGESNSTFVLECGTGVIHNILDTSISELTEGTVVRVYDNAFNVPNSDDNNLVSRILQDTGGVPVGSEEFHQSDAEIAAEMFAQE